MADIGIENIMPVELNTVDEWQQTTLGEICNMRAGTVFPRILQGKRTGKYPFVKVSDMNLGENTTFIRSANNYVDAEDLPRLKAKPLPAGTTIFAKIGEGLKQNRLRFLVKPTIVDNNMMGALPMTERVNPRFFFYALSQFDFGEIAEGTALPYLAVGDLSRLSLCLPPLSNQRAIARILGLLDDKIELNRQMNETLEAMARAIFKSWFVDFDPVRAKVEGREPVGIDAETATLFPSAFQDLPLGEIPKGREVERIGNLVEIVKGRSYRSSELTESDTALVTLKSILRGGGYRPDGLKPYTGKYKPEQIVAPGELVVSYTDVTQEAEVIGKPAIVRNTSEYKTLVASLDLGIIRPLRSTISGRFLYYLFRSYDFQSHINGYTTGTTVLHLSKDGVPSYQFALPTNGVLQRFDSIVNPLFARIESNESQSHILAQLRDTLLPKLLSGEIRVD